MLTRIITTSIFLLIVFMGNGQIDRQNTLSNQQVTSLVNFLHKKLDDTTHFKIQIRLAKYLFEKGIGDKADRDSVASLIRQAKEINARKLSGSQNGLILLYEATLARRNANIDSARQLLIQVINQLKSSNNNFQIAEAYLELTRTYDSHDPKQATSIRNLMDTLFSIVPKRIPRGQLDSCMATLKNFHIFQMYSDNLLIQLYYLDQFARASQTVNDKNRQFWARREMAYIHYQQGSLNKAISEVLKVAKEQKEGGHPHICFTYDRLSFYYYIATDYEKALSYALEATKNIRTAIDSANMPQFYQMVAVNQRQRGNIAEAVDWNLKMVDHMTTTKDFNGLYFTLSDLVRDMLPLGRAEEVLKLLLNSSRKYPPQSNREKSELLINLSQVYEALHNRAAAEKHSEALIMLTENLVKRKLLTGDERARAYQYLATFYMNTGQNDKAEEYFKKTIVHWPKGAQTQGREYEHRFLYRLDSARGNFRSAFEHMRTWHKILDSSLNATKAQQFDEIKVAYQTEQKDSLINLKEQNIQLLTKQDQLQRSKLKQGTILRNISLAAVGLSIIVMALFYNSYRLKKRTNQKLEIKQAEIEHQNITLHRVVNEKDWLVKEIHHRVKNNLQIIMSLLNSQSAFIDNEPALKAIHDSQHRVHAMSLIHQKLYNTENISSIDMNLYIRELASYLSDSFNIGRHIRFEFDIDPLEMDVTHAVPLGLILNEAITNSIKYAFPDNRSGIISVSLKKTTPNIYLLIISDNGIGISPAVNRKQPGSLGLSLIAGLTEDLSGTFSIENNSGTMTKITFVPDFDAHKMN